jgi:dUTP pyrophosphatase
MSSSSNIVNVTLSDILATVPVRATPHSAGFDFYSCVDVTVPAFGRVAVSTGVKISWDDPNMYLQLLSRSGLFLRFGLSCEGGVIDQDYNDIIYVLLQNHTVENYDIKVGDRICQGIFLPKIHVDRLIVSANSPSEMSFALVPDHQILKSSRTGGLGSSGL